MAVAGLMQRRLRWRRMRRQELLHAEIRHIFAHAFGDPHQAGQTLNELT